jgi:outer membrane protein W
MKKLLLLLVFFAVAGTVAVHAQDYKPFRVGLGLGYASPAGDGAKAGVLFYLEPSYRVMDKFAVGLKLEWAVMARAASYSSNGQNYAYDGKVSAAGSYTVNGQWYFRDSGFRPYAGLGLGLYKLASASVSGFGNGNTQVSNQSDAVSGGTKFGFYPRIGFDAGHFTMNIEYNIIGASTDTFQVDNNGTVTTAKVDQKNNYLGVRLGFFIGGGKK